MLDCFKITVIWENSKWRGLLSTIMLGVPISVTVGNYKNDTYKF